MTAKGGGSVSEWGRRRRLAALLIVLAIAVAVLGSAAYLSRPRSGSLQGPSAPSPPTNVLATVENGRITISWDAASDALSYHLYRASAPGVTKEGYAAMPDGARHENVIAPYTIAGLMGGRTYYFRVTAENDAGESEVSGEVSAVLVAPPSTLSPPTDVHATPGEGRVTISWNLVTGAVAYHVYLASVPGVTRDTYAALPDGARFANVVAPYTVAGLANGKTYYLRVTAENAAGESSESAEVSATPVAPPEPGFPLYVTGLVELDSGAPAVGATLVLRAEAVSTTVQATTGSDGRFNVGIDVSFPTRVLAEVTYRGTVGPSATGFRWSPTLEAGGAVDLGRVLLPDAATKQLDVAGGTATSRDGSIVVTNFPSTISTLWGRAYDPDAMPDVFPGDLAEGRALPLNSVVFLWISALDGSGQPVVDLGAPATVRMRVPLTQWVDAEDLQPGNGLIDTPTYSMDYATGYWVREANGRLTDAAGAPIGEAEEPAIRAGTYAGDVYAEFLAGHFSWWNVDYPPGNCTTDFGDADDPPYPTLLASDGARHLNICRAWLGAWVDGEDDARALEAYDDGLLGRNPLKLRVSNFNWIGDLYLNALIDENADGDWTDAGEWAIKNLPLSIPRFKGKVVETDVVWDGSTWLRLTLTGSSIQDYDGTGAFAIGETEDYPFLKYRLAVGVLGNGTVTSDPFGIDCRSTGRTCAAEYSPDTLVTLTATPDAGNKFLGWGLDCSGTDLTCTLRMDEDHEALAAFTAPTYTLSVWVSGSGVVRSIPSGIDCRWAGPGCSAEFPADTLVDLTATADAGWLFDRWGGDCSGSGTTCTVRMDRARSVFANFTRSSYRLSVWVVGNGTVTSEPPGIDCRSTSGTCLAEFPPGSDVILTATPDAGESFLTWGGDCSGSTATCTVRMDRDRFVVASFTSPYYVLFVYVYSSNPGNYSYEGGTVTSVPPGIDCRGNSTGGGNCSAYFAAGTNVTLTATPDPGWRFLGWGGDCAGTSPTCVVTMNWEKRVYAYFEKI